MKWLKMKYVKIIFIRNTEKRSDEKDFCIFFSALLKYSLYHDLNSIQLFTVCSLFFFFSYYCMVSGEKLNIISFQKLY